MMVFSEKKNRQTNFPFIANAAQNNKEKPRRVHERGREKKNDFFYRFFMTGNSR